MKLLVDNNLSPRLTTSLEFFGIEAVHVHNLGLGAATDDMIIEHAANSEFTILTADSDFGELAALGGLEKPSIIFLRGDFPTDPEALSILIANVCRLYENEIVAGAVLAVERNRVRIRNLPIGRI